MKCCEDVHGAAAHCARCHHTFSSVALFDRHQDVDYDRPQPVVCAEPQALGLVRGSNGTWMTPEGARALTGKVARLTLGRLARVA